MIMWEKWPCFKRVIILVLIWTSIGASLIMPKMNSKGKYGFLHGDIYLGGLLPIHQQSTGSVCSRTYDSGYGVQRLEAMYYAIRKINSDRKILPGVTIGAEFRDTCNSEPKALDESLQFVTSTAAACSYSSSFSAQDKIFGVVGASLSSVTAQVASLLRLFHVPQISYGSTSIDLSNNEHYDFLLRTVPSDKNQAHAMVSFIFEVLKWKTIYAVNSLGSYGERGMDAFRYKAKEVGLCIIEVREISQRSTAKELRNILLDFYDEPTVQGVVLFCEIPDVRQLLQASLEIDLASHFFWIASDGWGLKAPPSPVINAITFSLYYPKNNAAEFFKYYEQLAPKSIQESINPWFKEYWLQSCNQHKESKQEGIICSEENKEDLLSFQLCHPDVASKYCLHDDKVPYVIDAVYAFAIAAHQIYMNKCRWNKYCLQSAVKNGELMMEYLENLSFEGTSGNVSLGESNITTGFYAINLIKNSKFDLIGTWQSGSLNVSKTWKDELLQEDGASSTCGNECLAGYARFFRKETSCCWTCRKCKPRQYLENPSKCVDCKDGYTTNSNFTGCHLLPVYYWGTPWVVSIALLSTFGVGVTLFVIAMYIKYNNTPLIKASARELSYFLLVSIIISYSLPFCMTTYPVPATCAISRFGTGLCICMCYSALLVKTNRIARIFSGKQDLRFITPQWQLILTCILIMPQIIIGIIGIVISKPIPTYSYQSDKYTMVQCNDETVDLIVALSYNSILIICCTLYAFRTRKVPENFNEARYIGFVMYTNCVLWLTYFPVFFGAGPTYRSVTISLNLILNATTILVGLFGFKMYIVLFKPEKNISTMRSRSRTKSGYSEDMSSSICDDERKKISGSSITSADHIINQTINIALNKFIGKQKDANHIMNGKILTDSKVNSPCVIFSNTSNDIIHDRSQTIVTRC